MATIETDTANPERLVKRFITRFRQPDAYQRLAAHAALPLVLTPELLHYLRNAFLRGEVPWVAEADLLLSDLCEEVGYEQYVMVPAVRDRLIADLKQTYGEGRLKEAARLIWQYLLRVERTAPALGRDALQAQQWSAMAYLDSERVARENAEKIKAALVRSQDRDALASLAKITETLAPQLQSFPALVEYARQLSLLLSGETETTTGPEPPTTGQIGGPNVVVGGVELPPIKDVAEALSPKLSDVSEAIEKTLDLKIVPEERVRGDLPIGWTNLPPHNRFFTGREEILKQLRVALEEQRSAALVGMPGVGKTQTAIEYAHRYLTDYAAVLWVRSDTETSLASGYRALAEVLGLPEKDESDSNKVAAAVRRWLGREPGYLLILDNADDPSLVKPYLPPDPRGHVLLTSRAHNFDVLGIRKPIGLPVLTPDEALAFLLKHTDRDGPLDPAEQDAARTLAGELGYLPLALEQAAAYTVDHKEAFSTYLAVYRALQLPPKVFFSYRREDSAGVAGSIYDRLRVHFGPDAVFFDVDSVPFGVDFQEHIESVLSHCDVFLAVIGPDWAGQIKTGRRIDDPRDWVRIEVEAALKQGLPVIPVLIDDTRMPSEADLPPPLVPLVRRNAVRVDQGRDFHHHVELLIRGIQLLIQRAKVAPAPPSSPADSGQRSTPIPGRQPPAKVFISYSHDSDDHAGRVLELADALRGRGINVILDQYVHPAPEEGWPRWMERNIDEAQFVLMVCTETYCRRVMGREEPGKGLGVRWEGSLIYNDKPSGSRFIPILLPGSEPAHIPVPVRGHAYYRIATFDLTDPGFETLYRHLTGQAPTPVDQRTAGPIRLFYAYSHKDEALRDELEEHLALLKRQGYIVSWHDRRIGAGDEWKGTIDKNLEEAQVVLLLVSASFLASDYCWDVEMKRAVELHDRGEAGVIPVILRPCDWYGAPFGRLQALPKDARAVTSWANRDEAFNSIRQGIRNTIEGGAVQLPAVETCFISYSHDSDDHAGRVLELADALRGRGINVILDQYVHPAPEEGWPRWMDRNIDEAQFVLMVCTETYCRRVMGREEPGKGLGVRWEGSLIYNRIYNDKPSGSRFIPILLPGSEPAHIPVPVRGHAYYRIATFDLTAPGFETLYRHLTGQAPTPVDQRTARPIRLFYAYSHKDQALRDELEEHLAFLKRQGYIVSWHDRMIGAGEEWKGQLDKNLEEAQIILFLISPSFLASDYCYDVEIKRALDRHDKGEATVIPILLRPVDWEGAPFARLQGLPIDLRPVTTWTNKDEAFKNIAQGIRRAIEGRAVQLPAVETCFISYSHDSDDHAGRVLELADALRGRGINVILDQYVHPAPEEGWPRWMDRNIDEAQFVLMVCTETYRRRVMGREEPGKGLGVRWEGRLIYNRIYNDKPSGSRFIPILLPGSEPAHIPVPVRGHAYYRIATFDLTDPGFETLYRHLTGQAPTPVDQRTAGPIRLFYAYSHKDEELRKELNDHLSLLRRQGVISGWHDRMIGAGEEWKGQLDKNLEEAQIILFLISPSFLASDYCYDIEIKRALDRHDKGEATVIPILLRPVDWEGAPFARLQGLPIDLRPVTTWTNKDEAFKNIAQGIRRAIEGRAVQLPAVETCFISYSHDSDDHAGRVLELADALRGRGINVILDQYVHPAPEEGWPRWMDRNIDEAQFVLMVCTETYRRRVMGREEPGKGLGVRWEGRLVYNRIYNDKPSGSRFIPILLPGSEPAHIPVPVRGHAYYRITTFDLTDPGFEALYRHLLTGQAPTPPA